jgi:hypothetical protein
VSQSGSLVLLTNERAKRGSRPTEENTMTVYFITYAVVAATVAVGTFAFVERRRDAASPGILTVAACSVALGAVWRCYRWRWRS